MRYRIIGLLVFIGASLNIQAQKDQSFLIGFYSDICRNAVEVENRTHADQELYTLVKQALENQTLDLDLLDSLKWISVLRPEDKSFALISWMTEMENRISSYHNFIVFENQQYIELSDSSDQLYDFEYSRNYPDNHLCAYYYKLVDVEEGDYHLLFGYRTFNDFENIKLVDVISIEDGNVIFGKEVFSILDENGSEDNKTRLLLKYASDSQVSFQYNPFEKMIIYDHLIPRMGRLPGQGPTMLPDGSYEAFVLNKGNWIHKEKLFNQVSEQAPLPEPVLNGREGNNIFGKQK